MSSRFAGATRSRNCAQKAKLAMATTDLFLAKIESALISTVSTNSARPPSANKAGHGSAPIARLGHSLRAVVAGTSVRQASTTAGNF
jgi:hypothetical protein